MFSKSFAAFVESSPIGLMIVSVDMHILLANQAASDVFGYDVEELCNLTVEDLIPESNRSIHRHHIQTFANEGKNRLMGRSSGRSQFGAIRKDGSIVTIQIGLNKLEIEGECYFSVAVSDSSELIRLNRDLELNNKLLSARNAEIEQINSMQLHLMQVISHELKTPLHNTMSLVSLIRQHIPDPDPELAGWLDDLQSVSLDVVRGVRTVTDYADMISSQFELKPESTDLIELIDDRIKVAKAHFKDGLKHLKVNTIFDFRPVVWTDRIRLRRVMFGLISNAVLHADASEVVVNARLESIDNHKADFCFEVCDNGMGIRPEILERIFEPLSNREERMKRGKGGLGIGLFLFSRYIRLMGGQLSVDSTLGNGTIAHFRVPLEIVRRERLEGAEQGQQPMHTQLLAGKRIILVDDEPIVNKVMGAHLKKMGAEVFTAVNGKEALELVKACPSGQCFSLILMDLDMPVMNGFDATREIRKLEGGKDIPIFAVTAGIENESFPKALEAGMDACYSKPFDPRVLSYYNFPCPCPTSV